jgi:hypothetical protein
MRKKNLTENYTELSWEDAVTRFLEEHPDFLHSHPDLLVRLDVPHVGRGRAVSLIERQVQSLREANRGLQRQLHDLVDIARDNDALSERLHRVTVALLDASDLDEVLDTVRDVLRQEFKLDGTAIRIRCAMAPEESRSEFVPLDDDRFETLLRRLGRGRTICENRLAPDLGDYLFGGGRPTVRSCAVVALGEPRPWGLLALGSRDPERFRPDSGTLYLRRMGEVTSAALRRFIGA